MAFLFISLDSTTFKWAQVQYSPFETEAMGAVWFLTKEDYFTRGAQEIIIYNDAKNMNTFLKSDMNDVKNPRLFKMLEGNQMAVADWGSRSLRRCNEDFITKNSEMGITLQSLCVKQLDVHDPKLEDLAAIGANDPEYQQMIRYL